MDCLQGPCLDSYMGRESAQEGEVRDTPGGGSPWTGLRISLSEWGSPRATAGPLKSGVPCIAWVSGGS